MKTTVSQTGSFIPKWHDNRDEPESEQLIVEYDHLSWAARQKFITRDKTKYTIDDIEVKTDDEAVVDALDQHAKMEITAQTDDAGITAAMHPRLINFEDENGDAIDTWAKLIKIPSTPENEIELLIGEIITELSAGAKQNKSKNSK